jgi:hypothetical protein
MNGSHFASQGHRLMRAAHEKGSSMFLAHEIATTGPRDGANHA